MNGKQQHVQQVQRGTQRRKQQGRGNRPVELWRVPPELPELEPIEIPNDPSAMIRSLGDPPMNAAVQAGGYFAMVVDRVSGIARALAMSVDMLPKPDAD